MKRKGKRFLSLLLCICMALALPPVIVGAADIIISMEGEYHLGDYNSGDVIKVNTTAPVTITGDADTTFEDFRIECIEGVILTLDNVKIDNSSVGGACALSFTGAGNILTLMNNNSLKSGIGQPGVKVENGTALIINGSGTLEAVGGGAGAGIGSGLDSDGGSVTINGGNLTATGGVGGAGIGGGQNFTFGGNGGSVTINGGDVTATGGTGGAGIGGGESGNGGGSVTINGGVVTATGGSCGAGIGGGDNGNGGSVTISGGIIEANGGGREDGHGGAGIGGGDRGDGGSVNISGGTVTARGGTAGAGIGGGDFGNGGTVYISGGSVMAVATGGNAEKIGHGSSGAGGTLKNSAGAEGVNVYLTTVTLSGITAETEADSLTASLSGAPYGYGANDMFTDGDGKLYLYLPEGTITSIADTAADRYTGMITTAANPAGTVGELTALKVTGVSPTAGAPVSGQISITFSKAMDRSVGAVSISPDGVDYTALSEVGWSSGDTVYTVSYDALQFVTQYRVKAEGFQDSNGNPMLTDTTHTFTTVSNDATLSGLSISQGTLSPVFASGTHDYAASVSYSVGSLTVTATTNEANATLTVNGTGVASGVASPITLSVGDNTIEIIVTAQSGDTITYTITVTRASGGGGGGGYSEPSYNAIVSGGGSLYVTVDKSSSAASVTVGDTLGAVLRNGGNTTITMPFIPGVTSYKLGIPVAYLSTSGGGTLTFTTDTGSIALPADMLSGIAGAQGKKAEISIGLGDKTGLSEEVKTAVGERPLIELSLTLDGMQADWSNPNAPVTISIPYEPTDEELQNPDAIIIWYIDGSGNLHCVPNGRYDPETGTVTFETTHFSLYAVGYNPVSFNDVPDTAQYAAAVRFIAARGISKGTGGGNFSPEAKLSRGQFIFMLMKAYDIAPDSNPEDNFADAGNAYYTNYLAAAKRLGISAGVGNNLFAPEKDITRQEMFTMLYNALRAIDRLPRGNSGKTLSDFADAWQIAPWAKEAITLLVETGYIDGSGGRLTPDGVAIRAEMAELLYNLLGK